MKRSTVGIVASAVALIVGMVMWSTGGGVQAQVAQVAMDRVSIGGLVLNKGETPEAGVLVIAETDSLPTHFRRTVVTDEQGRFLVPDLPEGAYEVWVRGYGLRDSAPMKVARGQSITLRVASARTPQEAARVYPANYWSSLLQPPAKEEIPKDFASREQWITEMKRSCMGTCHQLGGGLTRLWTRPEDWEVVFSRAPRMGNTADRLGRLIDGATADQFMADVQKQLENWPV